MIPALPTLIMDRNDPVIVDANILLLFSKYSRCDLHSKYFCRGLETKLDVQIDKVDKEAN